MYLYSSVFHTVSFLPGSPQKPGCIFPLSHAYVVPLASVSLLHIRSLIMLFITLFPLVYSSCLPRSSKHRPVRLLSKAHGLWYSHNVRGQIYTQVEKNKTLLFVYFTFKSFRLQRGKLKILRCTVASIRRIKSVRNFFDKWNFISLLSFSDIWKSLLAVYALIFSQIKLTIHERTLNFLCFYFKPNIPTGKKQSFGVFSESFSWPDKLTSST